MQNMKSYFSSWKSFWKSSQIQTLTLPPSNIHFTNSNLNDLNHSMIDENLLIDLSTKLIDSISPPKLQICAHQNQWFALNNSHLLVYRQLERIGLCDSVVCDVIPSQDIPNGIRETLIPIVTSESNCSEDVKGCNETKVQSQDEVIYCSDMQADSCGYLEGEDSSVITGGDSDADSDDEFCEWQINPSSSTTEMPHDQSDDENENQKEMQCLL